MASQQFCLKWNNHTNNMLTTFKDLLQMEIFVDVTLACDGLSIKAHKMVLSACSDFFRSLFIENPCKHPVVILKDVSYKDLKAIVDFMYHGEVNVAQDQLSALLKTAETLKVKGLAEVNTENQSTNQQSTLPAQSVPVPSSSSTPLQVRSQQRRADSPPIHARHKRARPRKRSHSGSDQSDNEIVPMKIKEAHSPEIQEVQDSDISQVSHSSTVNIRSSIHSRSSVTQHEQPYEESEYDVEPSKLLEQSISSEAPSMSKASTSGMQGMGGDSQDLALVPTTDSSQFQEIDISPDIKPEITFDDQSLSPGGYVDQSSLAGPSGYQDNSLVPQDSQSQENHPHYVKNLAKDLVEPFLQRRISFENTSQKMGVTCAKLARGAILKPVSRKPVRCGKCPRARDRKTRVYCIRCSLPICSDCVKNVCENCL